MPSFAFIATDENGVKKSGRIEARNRDAAYNKLREEELFPLSLEPINQSKNVEDILDQFREIKQDTLVYFTRQLATMIDSGMSPLRAISTLQEQEPNLKFKEILANVLAEVENGSTLSDAMSRYPAAFSKIYIAMVRSGEESGSLHKSLTELASQLEKQSRLNKAIKSATMYPKIVLGFAFIIVSGLLMTIVPKFGNIFKESIQNTYDPASGEPRPDDSLPALTQFMLDMSQLLYPDRAKNLLWFLEVVGRFILLFVIIYLIIRLIKYVLNQDGPRSKARRGRSVTRAQGVSMDCKDALFHTWCGLN
jgi:type II secretory pathway component PulF